jgi:uncharacterized protein YceK
MNNKDRRPLVTFITFVLLTIMLISCVTGCSTVVPVTAKFPEPPKYATEACPDLQKLNDGSKLSDVASVVNTNYTTYYACAVKTDQWIEWYEIQKRIFEAVK